MGMGIKEHALFKGPLGAGLGTHKHDDLVYDYTLKDAWDYYEHSEWLSGDGDIVHETPGSLLTLFINKTYGETGKTKEIQDWRSILQKYVSYCQNTRKYMLKFR
ncbi:hypothetical protein I4U23_021990 [Adineta vaga]|nr:hypothetical protein I4U23_021990 [Adineta vaga]